MAYIYVADETFSIDSVILKNITYLIKGGYEVISDSASSDPNYNYTETDTNGYTVINAASGSHGVFHRNYTTGYDYIYLIRFKIRNTGDYMVYNKSLESGGGNSNRVLLRNCIFYKSSKGGCVAYCSSTTSTPTIQFIRCTVYNFTGLATGTIRHHLTINSSIINSVDSLHLNPHNDTTTADYSDFYNCGFSTPSGTGNING